MYNKLQLGDYVDYSNNSLKEKHKKFFLSSSNMITLLGKVFLISVLESTLLKCFNSQNRFCSTYEPEKIIMIFVNLAFILKNRLLFCLYILISYSALDVSQDCFLNKYENILDDINLQMFGKMLHIIIDQTKRYDNLLVNHIELITFFSLLILYIPDLFSLNLSSWMFLDKFFAQKK